MPTRAITGTGTATAASARPGWRIDYDALVRWVFGVFVLCGFIAFIEPSPYDLAFFLILPLWFMGGFRIHPAILPLFGAIFLYNLGGFISLVPHLDESDPKVFMLLSLYLASTAVFFALFFAEDTVRRTELCLKVYAASTVLAALCGIIGYVGIDGLNAIFSRYGRASGSFKDPNVMGSYLVLGGVYFVQTLVLRKTRHVVATSLCLMIVVAGIFLSFSRGSWAAFLVATLLSIGLTYATSADPKLRRRIVAMSVAAALLTTLAVIVLLMFSGVRTLFLERATLEQDYDSGATGRFGNQIRSLPMLLDNINGLGPLRFRLIFGLEPHDTYINAFASYGWLGGFGFLLLVGLTTYVGFRVAWRPSPYRRIAQVYWPSLFVFFLQAFQIDIDHWRHVFLLLGAVWGLEAARARWQAEPRSAGLPRRIDGHAVIEPGQRKIMAESRTAA